MHEVTKAPKGFAGAIGIKARIIADYSLTNMVNFVMGANKEDHHVKNVNIGRDFKAGEFADVRIIKETDPCPKCGHVLEFARGIEVGHVFKLGTKYSKMMHAVYLDRNGQEQLMQMGCYGIGVGRTVAATIEQSHDDKGIIWPMTIAPYQVIITPVNVNDAALLRTAEVIYGSLREQGLEAILDDRDERAGVKFNDADLIGIPIRVTVGPKRLAEGCVEVKLRKADQAAVVSLEDVTGFIVNKVQEELASIECFE